MVILDIDMGYLVTLHVRMMPFNQRHEVAI